MLVATETYAIPAAKVRDAIDKLLSRRTHAWFPAYLHIRREAATQGRMEEIEPNWNVLSEDLRMTGGPDGKVHMRPFWNEARNAHQEWMGPNLPGSYSPSSIRRAALEVITVDAAGRYGLREQHWNLALTHLLNDERLSAVALAAFMLRDRGWRAETLPTVTDLVAGFRAEFGYGPDDDVEFDTLYESEWGTGPDEEWFEVLDVEPRDD